LVYCAAKIKSFLYWPNIALPFFAECDELIGKEIDNGEKGHSYQVVVILVVGGGVFVEPHQKSVLECIAYYEHQDEWYECLPPRGPAPECPFTIPNEAIDESCYITDQIGRTVFHAGDFE